MRSAIRGAAALVVLATGCPDTVDSVPVQPGGPFTRVAAVQETLRLTRQAGAPPATVLAELELSEVALAGFLQLEVMVDVYSGESVPGQGLRAQWLGEPLTEPVAGDFEGELAAAWSAELLVTSRPCSGLPCVMSLEIVPQGTWDGPLSFPIEYEVLARLDFERADPAYAPDEMALSVEAQP